MMPYAYALIHEEDGSFGISFPDFPGAVTAGDSVEDAIRRGSTLLTFHAAGMAKDNEPLPVLRDMSELKADPAFVEDSQGAAIAVVPFDLPTRSVRINVSVEESLLNQIDKAASSAGLTRSAFFADAARSRLKEAR